MATKAEIVANAKVIKEETRNGANTATRVGQTLEDLANKSVGYKVYIAELSQTGTNAPVANVIENTLGGDIVWSYAYTGAYNGTLAGAFDFVGTFIKNDYRVAKGGLRTVLSQGYVGSPNFVQILSYEIQIH